MNDLAGLCVIKDSSIEKSLQVDRLKTEMDHAEAEFDIIEDDYRELCEFISFLNKLEKYISPTVINLIIDKLDNVKNEVENKYDLYLKKSDLASSMYTLKVCEINMGDVIEFKDCSGRYCALSVEIATLVREDFVFLCGPRVTKKGDVGKIYKRCTVKISSIQSMLKKV